MKHVLLMDHDSAVLESTKQALKEKYRVSLLSNESLTIEDVKKLKPDLIILSVFDEYSLNLFDIIRKEMDTKRLPVIVLAKDWTTVSKTISLGAADFLTIPFITEALLLRTELQLELNSFRYDRSEAEKFQDAISVSFAELVEFRDETTGGHIKNTTLYFRILLEALLQEDRYRDAISVEDVKNLLRSAPLHDIGKIGINDDILRKATSLDYNEYEYMKTHTTLGKQAFDRIIQEAGGTDWLYLARDIAYCHHERWDGTGYPNGLKGEEIPFYARVLTIADVYDALTSRRSYKEAFSHERAVEIILEGKGTIFDPELVDLFKKASDCFEQALLHMENASK